MTLDGRRHRKKQPLKIRITMTESGKQTGAGRRQLWTPPSQALAVGRTIDGRMTLDGRRHRRKQPLKIRIRMTESGKQTGAGRRQLLTPPSQALAVGRTIDGSSH